MCRGGNFLKKILVILLMICMVASVTACKKKNDKSSETDAKNTTQVEKQVLAEPVFVTPSGSLDAGAEVVIDVAAGTTVYYTIDGTDPSDASTRYDGPIRLSAGEVLVKAIAMDTSGNKSTVARSTYSVKAKEEPTETSKPTPNQDTTQLDNTVAGVWVSQNGVLFYFEGNSARAAQMYSEWSPARAFSVTESSDDGATIVFDDNGSTNTFVYGASGDNQINFTLNNPDGPITYTLQYVCATPEELNSEKGQARLLEIVNG